MSRADVRAGTFSHKISSSRQDVSEVPYRWRCVIPRITFCCSFFCATTLVFASLFGWSFANHLKSAESSQFVCPRRATGMRRMSETDNSWFPLQRFIPAGTSEVDRRDYESNLNEVMPRVQTNVSLFFPLNELRTNDGEDWSTSLCRSDNPDCPETCRFHLMDQINSLVSPFINVVRGPHIVLGVTRVYGMDTICPDNICDNTRRGDLSRPCNRFVDCGLSGRPHSESNTDICDRGHIISSSAIGQHKGMAATTFHMCNVASQTIELNRCKWNVLERFFINLGRTYDNLIDISGSLFEEDVGGCGANSPTHQFKFILVEDTKEAFLFIMKNDQNGVYQRCDFVYPSDLYYALDQLRKGGFDFYHLPQIYDFPASTKPQRQPDIQPSDNANTNCAQALLQGETENLQSICTCDLS